MIYCDKDTAGVDGGKFTTTGRLEADETWSGDIILTGDIEIPQGITLTIKPGTTVKFTAQSDDQHGYDEYDPEDRSTIHAIMISVLVQGILKAQGTADQPVIFKSTSTEPDTMDWYGIMVDGDGTADLSHVIIEYSYFGLQLNTNTCMASLHNSTFRNIGTTGIATGDHPIAGPITITDNRFIAIGREAIDTYKNQEMLIKHNVFTQNYAAIMSVGSSVTIENNLFINNLRGVGVVENGDPVIIANEFTENQGAAIFVTNASPIITNNNIYANIFNLELGGPQGVTAENNWWGSTDTTEIKASIIDNADFPGLGAVDFYPFAQAPFVLDVPEF
jgi:hypothetical protein